MNRQDRGLLIYFLIPGLWIRVLNRPVPTKSNEDITTRKKNTTRRMKQKKNPKTNLAKFDPQNCMCARWCGIHQRCTWLDGTEFVSLSVLCPSLGNTKLYCATMRPTRFKSKDSLRTLKHRPTEWPSFRGASNQNTSTKYLWCDCQFPVP